VPEYRKDNITGRLVIVAEERANRPRQFDIDEPVQPLHQRRAKDVICPFCPGNEDEKPATVDYIGVPQDWRCRAVPNKYPAVCDDGGRHEVIVDTPRHVLSLCDLTGDEVADMLRMYKRRLLFYRQEQRWQYVQIFKNVGAAAGASLPHSHSQLIAMPFVPPQWTQIFRRAAEYRSETGICYWCSRLESERETQERIVETTPHFIVLCPYVSRFAAEVEIYPAVHQSAFDALDETEIPELADVLRRTIQRLEKTVYWMKDRLAYNVVLNTESFEHELEFSASMHWHFSILPSLARAAGFEWGTALHINPVAPEQAAQRLRDIEIV
jgi:UDPglucose--hexose-1-phosphate uridylyltransferase